MRFSPPHIPIIKNMGFFGEFLVITSALSINILLAVGAGSGMVLGAVYGLKMYRSIFFDLPKKEKSIASLPLRLHEFYTLVPLGCLVIFFGLYPAPLFKLITPSVQHVLSVMQRKQVLQIQTKNALGCNHKKKGSA